MGTIAVTALHQGVQDNRRVVEATVTGSDSYATGGDTIPLSTLGLNRIIAIDLPSHGRGGARTAMQGAAISDAQAQTGKSVQLGGTVLIPKLKYFDTANTEVSAAADLSGVTHVIRFIGN